MGFDGHVQQRNDERDDEHARPRGHRSAYFDTRNEPHRDRDGNEDAVTRSTKFMAFTYFLLSFL